MPEIAAATIEWLLSNPMMAATSVLIGLLAWWIIDERSDAESAEETVEGVTSRAQSATSTVLGSSRKAMVGLAGIGITASLEFLQLASELNQMFGGIPVLAGHLVFGALTFVGVPTLGLSREILGLAFIVITLLALFARYGSPAAGGGR